MALITLRDVCVGFGGPNLLDGVDLEIEKGERLCLLGRNGTGKSTLMKLIAGEVVNDDGSVMRQQELGIAYLTQDVPQGLCGTVYDVVAGGFGEEGALLSRYHAVSMTVAEQGDEKQLLELERIQHELEVCGGWQHGQRVETLLSRLQLPVDDEFENLSGGLKRRVLLARALITEPDLLLLDEPTNHLDIEAIAWLEEFLKGWNGTLLFVTHDRQFLRNLATRIIELDRGSLSSWPGDYDNYLRRKQEVLAAEEKQNAEFDKKLAREEAWIRQGIKARRTRNEGRVRALKALREQRKERRELSGKARLQLNQAEISGKMVIEAEGISYRYDDKAVVQGLSTTIFRGDRIGIIGPNGVGKTTLIQLLLGQLPPDNGTVRMGTKIELAYFDQHRAQLDGEKSVLDNLAEGSDKVVINGSPRHVMSYLQDFLFSPERARSPVRSLSGGERNRLLLAKLFARPSNLLVMDEPTNDLDVETLELLEELLLDYPGTLLLVSHDRAFLNNVVTSTLVFEGEGQVHEYVGGYDDWLRQRSGAITTNQKKEKQKNVKPRVKNNDVRKLGYREQRELEQLPKRIEALEAEQEKLHKEMADPAFYQQDGEVIASASEKLETLERELMEAYERWESLESHQSG